MTRVSTIVRRALLLATVLSFAVALSACYVTPWGAGIAVGFPPPAPHAEVRILAPGPGFLWVPGHWSWSPPVANYVWIAGAWARPPRPRAVWMAPRWHRRGGSWYFVEGYWR